jgi:multiple sugar transport system permease protein
MQAPIRSGYRRPFRETLKTILMTLFAALCAFLFLLPFGNMVLTSLRTQEQMMMEGAPLYPAEPATYTYEGEELEIFNVPMEDGSTQELAMLKPGRRQSEFINPQNPEAEPIVWQGAWRTLEKSWEWSPSWQNFSEAWNAINFPRLFRNTLLIAVFGIVGTLLSSTMVAYGFARFRFPGKELLFTLLVSTIFLPAAVTVVPTYAFFNYIGWVGTWLPLIVPHFFSNAYNVFLLRQYMMTIPREMDEAAQIDGAGPVRILWSVILPQCKAVLLAVTLFHLVFAWNDYFAPLIYLSTRPDLQPISLGLAQFRGIYGQNPPLIQAAALMALIVPVLLFFFAQRAFMQGVVVTGVEK